MARAATIDKVVTRLMWLLRMHGKFAARAHRIIYKAPPMTTEAVFEAVPIRELMCPPTPDTGPETQQLFDTWMWPHHTHEGDSVEDLTEADQLLCQYVTKRGDFGEQTVRLLFALSTAEGARLAWDGNSIMVHHDECSYGIIDGVVHSRFCTGAKVVVDHREVLTRRPELRSMDTHFYSLYREANRRGKGLVDVLAAIHMGQPGFNFRRMAEMSVPKRTPSKTQMEAWLKILYNPKDPVAALYKQLVPKWMSSGQFTKVICSLGSRPLPPNPVTQQMYINRLYAHFFKDE